MRPAAPAPGPPSDPGPAVTGAAAPEPSSPDVRGRAAAGPREGRGDGVDREATGAAAGDRPLSPSPVPLPEAGGRWEGPAHPPAVEPRRAHGQPPSPPSPRRDPLAVLPPGARSPQPLSYDARPGPGSPLRTAHGPHTTWTSPAGLPPRPNPPFTAQDAAYGPHGTPHGTPHGPRSPQPTAGSPSVATHSPGPSDAGPHRNAHRPQSAPRATPPAAYTPKRQAPGPQRAQPALSPPPHTRQHAHLGPRGTSRTTPTRGPQSTYLRPSTMPAARRSSRSDGRPKPAARHPVAHGDAWLYRTEPPPDAHSTIPGRREASEEGGGDRAPGGGMISGSATGPSGADSPECHHKLSPSDLFPAASPQVSHLDLGAGAGEGAHSAELAHTAAPTQSPSASDLVALHSHRIASHRIHSPVHTPGRRHSDSHRSPNPTPSQSHGWTHSQGHSHSPSPAASVRCQSQSSRLPLTSRSLSPGRSTVSHSRPRSVLLSPKHEWVCGSFMGSRPQGPRLETQRRAEKCAKGVGVGSSSPVLDVVLPSGVALVYPEAEEQEWSPEDAGHADVCEGNGHTLWGGGSSTASSVLGSVFASSTAATSSPALRPASASPFQSIGERTSCSEALQDGSRSGGLWGQMGTEVRASCEQVHHGGIDLQGMPQGTEVEMTPVQKTLRILGTV